MTYAVVHDVGVDADNIGINGGTNADLFMQKATDNDGGENGITRTAPYSVFSM